MNEKDLLELKSKVDDAKVLVSELKGSKQALMKQLKDEYECSTLEEAERKLGSLEKEVEKLNQKIKTGLEALETKYELS